MVAGELAALSAFHESGPVGSALTHHVILQHVTKGSSTSISNTSVGWWLYFFFFFCPPKGIYCFHKAASWTEVLPLSAEPAQLIVPSNFPAGDEEGQLHSWGQLSPKGL